MTAETYTNTVVGHGKYIKSELPDSELPPLRWTPRFSQGQARSGSPFAASGTCCPATQRCACACFLVPVTRAPVTRPENVMLEGCALCTRNDSRKVKSILRTVSNVRSNAINDTFHTAHKVIICPGCEGLTHPPAAGGIVARNIHDGFRCPKSHHPARRRTRLFHS